MGRYSEYSLEERIMSKVEIDSNDCWNWQGAINNAGFGMVRISSQDGMGTTHKQMYQITNNTIVPHGLCVLHRCGNYLCCNPAHLHVGTRKDLAQKIITDGKYKPFGGVGMKGKKHPTTTCPHCKRAIANNVYARHHGDNCKLKPKSINNI